MFFGHNQDIEWPIIQFPSSFILSLAMSRYLDVPSSTLGGESLTLHSSVGRAQDCNRSFAILERGGGVPGVSAPSPCSCSGVFLWVLHRAVQHY